ncbi:sensor histidine kinase [Chamaesiphon polymorphus]|nr:PAS domain-containing sensor histidine kinase [Chamaesiphon polymorphus]
MEYFTNLWMSDLFIPHGHCYLWKTELVGLHLISDLTIAIAYFSIPLTLFHFVEKREDLPFNWIFSLFGAFIILCGTTHLLEIWTLWHPVYWLSGTVKAMTGIVSAYTAVVLVKLIPQALQLPSPAQLAATNQALEQQIRDRELVEAQLQQVNDELEARVAARTLELEASMLLTQNLAERMTLATNAARMGVFDWNIVADKVAWNEYHAKILGYTFGAAEYSYADWERRVHLEDLPAVKVAVELAMNTGTDYSEQYRVIWPDGSIYWIDAFGRFYYNDGRPVRMTGIICDVTERKQTELFLQAQTLKLAKTTALLERRNQELDQFAYIVSHDLKAPLRGIANLSEWIEESLAENIDAEIQEYLNLMRSRVVRMGSLIDGLLDYARVGQTEVSLTTFAIEDLLAEIIDSLNIPASFKFDLPTNLPPIVTNRLLLSQVFANLIGNAYKHHDRTDGHIQITAQLQADLWEFTVTDDGPGIPAADRERVFDIFQTLVERDRQGNTGIGLSIVKKLVHSHGGEIAIESELGRGTTFRFTWSQGS